MLNAPDRPLSPTLAVALSRLLADLAADKWEREERFRRRILSESQRKTVGTPPVVPAKGITYPK